MNKKRSNPLARRPQNAPAAQTETDRKEVQTTTLSGEVNIQQFRVPLPPPELLRQYDLTVPGLAERIVQSVERQSDHRMQLEAKVIDNDVRISSRGQVFGFLFLMSVLAASVYLVTQGYELAGTIIGSADGLTAASVLIYAGRTRAKEREKKAKIMAGNH